MTSIPKSRISSIDIVRGLAMVIMALDHVRDYFHMDANLKDPLDLSSTSLALFLSRWITHFCAPIFVFLSGTSIYLQSLRKTKTELSQFIIKRGLWLILAEWLIIAMAWTFNPKYTFIPFQVIWAIGISMLLLGFLIRLPFNLILSIGFIIVVGHNLLDYNEASAGFTSGFWWDLFHHGHFVTYEFAPNHFALIVYPFLPWTGLMLLGYCFGIFFSKNYTSTERRNIFYKLGVSIILLFIGLRLLNAYGDPQAWTIQKNSLYSILSFIKTQKYPPSLAYLLMTIGPSLIFLAWFEKMNNRISQVMEVFGRTAFFFYILHIYLIHLFCTVAFFARGHNLEDAYGSLGNLPFLFVIPGEGYSLVTVYILWALVLFILYPLCWKYDKYKMLHKEKWWLSYL